MLPMAARTNFNSRPSARGDVTLLKSGGNCIFQFTPLREGRPPPTSTRTTTKYFNSRPSARGDDKPLMARVFEPISIHAPPRGATVPSAARYCGFTFQFTPLREGRRYMVKKGEHAALFQFTPLREGRPTSGTRWETCTPFQFTPLREGRRLLRDGHAGAAISIHAPPRGATPARISPGCEVHFNSRPSARGDSQPR